MRISTCWITCLPNQLATREKEDGDGDASTSKNSIRALAEKVFTNGSTTGTTNDLVVQDDGGDDHVDHHEQEEGGDEEEWMGFSD